MVYFCSAFLILGIWLVLKRENKINQTWTHEIMCHWTWCCLSKMKMISYGVNQCAFTTETHPHFILYSSFNDCEIENTRWLVSIIMIHQRTTTDHRGSSVLNLPNAWRLRTLCTACCDNAMCFLSRVTSHRDACTWYYCNHHSFAELFVPVAGCQDTSRNVMADLTMQILNVAYCRRR